jgi:hypothetical protein
MSRENTFLYGRAATLFVGVAGGQGKDLSGLRIGFNIEKTSETTPNTSTIDIYNIAESTRSLLKEKNVSIILKAGYGTILLPNQTPILEIIFKGTVTRANTRKQGGDLITTIECADGINAYTEANINESFKSGTKTEQVFNALASKMGLGVGSVSGVEGGQFLQGFSASGMVRDILDTVTGKTNTEWSIQDEKLQVVPKAQPKNNSVAFLLTPNTGLVESPNTTKEGVEFKSLLIPSLMPGRTVKLESTFISGTYILRKVNHVGDTHEGSWHSECECRL